MVTGRNLLPALPVNASSSEFLDTMTVMAL